MQPRGGAHGGYQGVPLCAAGHPCLLATDALRLLPPAGTAQHQEMAGPCCVPWHAVPDSSVVPHLQGMSVSKHCGTEPFWCTLPRTGMLVLASVA